MFLIYISTSTYRYSFRYVPIYIKGKRSSAVILSKEDYESMQETLYFHTKPGLVKMILEASSEPLEECVDHNEAWK